MRHQRPLHDLTRAALEGRVKQISDELGVSDKYLYGILSGYNSDPFANFRPLFRAALRVDLAAGRAWFDDLRALYLAECLRRTSGPLAPDAGSAAGIHKESSEAVNAALENRPVAEQRRELIEAIERFHARLLLLDEQEATQAGGGLVQ
jgi:transcriptional regulator with XRE-family HTH domain